MSTDLDQKQQLLHLFRSDNNYLSFVAKDKNKRNYYNRQNLF